MIDADELMEDVVRAIIGGAVICFSVGVVVGWLVWG
jgi:hypothetical protein